MRTEVDEAGLARYAQIASEITSKIMQARNLLVTSGVASVILHVKEMNFMLAKCASHAEAFLSDTREQCDAHRLGVDSYQRQVLGRVRRRYEKRKQTQAKKPVADQK